MSLIVSTGKTSNVSAGQIAIGDIVQNGGTLNVLSGGTISNTQDSGTLNVSLGGLASGTVVIDGAEQDVHDTGDGC
jgi:autotransporter passenger strand-loop-strand repeat protein